MRDDGQRLDAGDFARVFYLDVDGIGRTERMGKRARGEEGRGGRRVRRVNYALRAGNVRALAGRAHFHANLADGAG